MKLVKIENVRVGQIYRNSHWDLALIKNVNSERIELHQWNYDISSENDYNTTPNYITENACNWKLIGKLGITHEIKDRMLVEIPRDEFQVDDVFYTTLATKSGLDPYYDPGCDFKEIEDVIFFLFEKSIFDVRGNEYRLDFCEKIGIYGVTHEFVNDCEIK